VIGEVVGSYRVLAKIGAGGMGTVWLGEHLLLGSRAAIKVLQPGMSSQEKIVQRFFDEAKASSRIRDPGIVTVLDFGKHNGDAYIVMELLQGNTLTQRLGHDKMPPLEAMRLVQMSALAMAAAHARGIIHRDLKPDNIFVVADPAVPGGERVKILDFGIAKLIDRDPEVGYMPTVAGTIMGTPAFMSPEQCRAAGEVDHRADIYALGCVLFNLLCGRPPFIAQTQGDMIVAQIQDEPPRPSTLVPGLAPEIDALVLRCLQKNPADRFQTMTDIVRAGAAITGDNNAIGTIPPMVAQDHAATGTGPETMPSTPPTDTREPKSPSEGGEMAQQTQITSPPVTTTLAGSATAVDTSSSMPVHRPRYGVLALLILGLVGGIAIATVFGGHRERAVVTPPADAMMPIDAAAKPMAAVIDAKAAIAPPVDATELIPLKTIPRPPRHTDEPGLPRQRGVDAGLYDHR
jgi:serine/threonine protein kinase